MATIYYDTETTGTRSDQDRIIEIAAYDATSNRTFNELINPGISIPKEASQIHHITDEMVQSALSFKEVGQAFIDFCGPNAFLIAHNNDSFDLPFLKTEMERHGLTLPKWNYIDSLKWSRKYRTDLPRHSLQHLREVYGIAANQAHRALNDVMVLYQVFSSMIDDLPIELVLNLLSKSTLTERMPFGKYQGRPLSEVPSNYVSWLKSSGAFDKQENNQLKESFEKLGLLN
ncbi:MAG TPA: DUF3820 family protein [Rhabdochlamydiaceae bacterium]|nr:DUF3820 family protein [Rhabdochlamydiaceae bacterium]